MFSGVGGFDLALQRQGHECVGYSEIDKFAVQTYIKNFGDEVKNYGDAKEIDPGKLPEFELLVGGFPCQAFSIAGKRRGFGDTRGTLFFEIARILESKKPKHFLLENVKGLLNHEKGKTFGKIITTLSELGYNVEWVVLNSKFFGVPQNRERVFIIGSLGKGSGCKVFPFGENAAKIQGIPREEKVHPALDANYYKGVSNQRKCLVHKEEKPIKIGDHQKDYLQPLNGVCGTLEATSYKQPPQILTLERKEFREHKTEGNPTLKSRMGTGGNNVPMIVARRGRDTEKGREQQFELRKDNVSNSITSVEKDNLVMGTVTGAFGRSGCSREEMAMVEKIMNWLWRLRRLTPVECERLQGFPDFFTVEGIDEKGKIVKVSDMQRYKQMGNAVTVNVVEYLAKNLYGAGLA